MYTVTSAVYEPNRTAVTRPQPTLGFVSERWLEQLRGAVKPSTWSNYAAIARKYIPPELAAVPISSVTNEALDSLLSAAAGPPGREKLSASRLNSINTVLKSIFDYAGRSGLCELKYSFKVKSGAHRDAKLPLTPEEQRALERTLLSDSGSAGAGILLSLYTGLRIGELCALRWGDISLAAGTLNVRRTVQRIRILDAGPYEPHTRLIFDEPKSASSRRIIPLPGFLTELLRPFEAAPEVWLLTGSAERFMEPRTLQNQFRSVLDAAGVRRVNFHILRHTFATNCVNLGCDAKTLSELLGHADVGVTMNTYGRIAAGDGSPGRGRYAARRHGDKHQRSHRRCRARRFQ